MISLVLDFETRSKYDIKKVGLDVYMTDAMPLCVAWAIDDGTVELIEFGEASEEASVSKRRFWGCIRDSRITKVAQNISFERAMLRKLGLDTPLTEWVDTSVLARYAGLPSKLADICKALRLGDLGKHADGSRLIAKFSCPKKDGTFRDKTSDPEDWQKFLDYCKQDVIAEREVFKHMHAFHLGEREKRIWALDDKINRRGLPVDMDYVHSASRQAAAEKRRLLQELKELTGLANPNSRDQFLGWAKSQGYEFSSLGKAFIARMEKMLEEDERDEKGVALWGYARAYERNNR